MTSKPYPIRERALLFAGDVVAFGRLCHQRDETIKLLVRQLVTAAGSVGANLEEAVGGQSRADFLSKVSIALKECREALYWLRLVGRSEPSLRQHSEPLIAEANELVAILTTIVKKGRSRKAP